MGLKKNEQSNYSCETFQFFEIPIFSSFKISDFLIIVPILVFYFVILCISFQFSFLFLVKLCWYIQPKYDLKIHSKKLSDNFHIMTLPMCYVCCQSVQNKVF